MTDKFYIDGIDAFTEFGVFVTEGGYNELVAFPPLKTPKSIEWQEEDGIEADLSAPVLDSREFSMHFCACGAAPDYSGFIELLSDGAYHEFDLREIGRTCKLRMTSNPGLTMLDWFGKFTLQFADDFPLDSYSYAEPESTVDAYGDYELDGRMLTDYGVRVLEGTLDEIQKSPAMKQNLLRNIGMASGAIYDGERVTFKAKDVKINCLMRAATLLELWRNYHALLYDLVRPGERILYVDATGEEYPCYYKNCTVSEFYASGEIWLAFSLTLVFSSFRLSEVEYLLAGEDNALILDEEGENYIEVK